MSSTLRAATEAAVSAFALSALAIFVLPTSFLRVHAGGAVLPAFGLGMIAAATVFVAVSVAVRRRLSGHETVLGAKRGAAIAVLAVVVVASVHAGFTAGSAGLLPSLLGQGGYACAVGGGPACPGGCPARALP